MNRDEVLAMKPGKELDTLVAEKVMGGVQITNETVWNLKWQIGDALHLHCPSYSSDISAAWEVVEKLKPRGISFWFDTEKWVFETHGNNEQTVYHISESVPEAICKAALLAVLDA